MSAPVLTVDRLHATVRGPGPAAARLGALVPRLAGAGLEADLAGLPAGHWCLRTLHVGVALDPDLPAPALVLAWARAVGTAVRGAGGVVYYRHDLDALTDLVVELAAGRPERAWSGRAHRAGTSAGASAGTSPICAHAHARSGRPAASSTTRSVRASRSWR